MGWPCRAELWGATLEQARADYATVANAIAAFEPVTMIANPGADAAAARAACGAGRRGRRAAARRLVAARLRPDLRLRRRRGARRPCTSASTPGGRSSRLGPRRRGRRPDRRAARRPGACSAARARGRLDPHRRPGHAAHHRAVPAEPRTATLRSSPRGDRGRAARAARRRAVRVARPGPGRGSRHRRPRRPDRRVHRPGPRAAPDRAARTTPTSRTAQENRERLRAAGTRGHRAAAAALRGGGRRARSRPAT